MYKQEEIIANNIWKLRIAKEWTQSQLAENASVSLRTIQAIENEGQIPRAVNLGKIAAALEAKIDDLFIDPFSSKTEPQLNKNEILGSIVSIMATMTQDKLKAVLNFINNLAS
jgi:transcriptional regulator with XRE-family HTH domain